MEAGESLPSNMLAEIATGMPGLGLAVLRDEPESSLSKYSILSVDENASGVQRTGYYVEVEAEPKLPSR